MKHLQLFEDYISRNNIPLVLYHCTNDTFDVFDIEKSKNDSMYGKGIYFTDNLNYAKKFGEYIIKVNLNMDNPFDMTKNNMNHFQELEFLIPDEDKNRFYEYLISKSYVSCYTWMRYKNYIKNTDLEDLGYDGIIGYCEEGGKEYITFDTKNIKIIK